MSDDPSRPRAVLMADDVPWVSGDVFSKVYGASLLSRIAQISDLVSPRITSANFEQNSTILAQVEVIFSCWGMPRLTASQAAAMPRLKAVFYAGGSVKGFAGPLLERGIIVCSAASANAIPVAEFCLGQILLSCKGAYRNAAICKYGPWSPGMIPIGPGNYRTTVALIAIGAVSKHLLMLLRSFDLNIIAVSDYLTDEEARKLGIDRLVDIDTAFRDAQVVSNHLPDLPSLRRVFTRSHFASMRRGATFINTGRGAQVDEIALVDVLRERPDLTALLDVQEPEPPCRGSAFYSLPNIHMTSHISGSANDEVHRMADMVLAEYEAWSKGLALKHRVSTEALMSKA